MELYWNSGARPDVRVLVALGDGFARYGSSRTGETLSLNDRATAVWDALGGGPATEGCRWGILSVAIPNSSALNTEYHYQRVDDILLALDHEAASVAVEGEAAHLEAFAAHPFFREADRLLVPFRYPGRLRAGIGEALHRLAAHLAAAAFAAAKDTEQGTKKTIPVRGETPEVSGDRPQFSLRIAWTLDIGESCPNLPKALLAEADAQEAALRKSEPDAALALIGRRTPGDEFETCPESAFTRVSEAAQAVIARTSPDTGAEEWLLRFNRKHGCYSPVGGHCEWIDLNDPRRTLLREIQEETGLDLAPESLHLLNGEGPLLFTEYSEAKREFTRYIWHVFRVDWPPDGHRVENLKSAEELRWFSQDEIRDHPQVSPLVRRRLLDI